MGRTILLLAISAGLALSGCTSMPRPLVKPLSKLEARHMSHEALTRRAGAMLTDALIYYPVNESKRPVAVLNEMYFHMKPQSTGWRGLCSITTVTLHFAPEVSADADSRTDRKSTRLNPVTSASRMPSSA